MTRSVVEVVRDVKGPRPLLSREAEEALTGRQRELLARLHEVFAGGFAHLTMADLASAASCSLRTLYELAPSKDDLVRLVVDHRLWAIGRTAHAAITDDMEPLDAIRAHLHAAHAAVSGLTEAFATDMTHDAGTEAVNRGHAAYLVDVTLALLDEATSRGQIAGVDNAAVARVLANAGADFVDPAVLPHLRSAPDTAADQIVNLVLRGLTDVPGPRSDSR
ncbi:MAG: TetR/AcrR family transcriptional regulator [Actinomycetota bacterium]